MKKRGEAPKIILGYLLFAGLLVVASTSPYFATNFIRSLRRHIGKKAKDNFKKSYADSFYYLKKKGYIETENRNGQIYISLTEEGREKAGKYRIDDLKIRKPEKWDRKWRMLMFDIEEQHRAKREALRGKIKQLGLYKLQRSVWVCPYDFTDEVAALRDFFDLGNREMTVITANEIEDSSDIAKYFNL